MIRNMVIQKKILLLAVLKLESARPENAGSIRKAIRVGLKFK